MTELYSKVLQRLPFIFSPLFPLLSCSVSPFFSFSFSCFRTVCVLSAGFWIITFLPRRLETPNLDKTDPVTGSSTSYPIDPRVLFHQMQNRCSFACKRLVFLPESCETTAIGFLFHIPPQNIHLQDADQTVSSVLLLL